MEVFDERVAASINARLFEHFICAAAAPVGLAVPTSGTVSRSIQVGRITVAPVYQETSVATAPLAAGPNGAGLAAIPIAPRLPVLAVDIEEAARMIGVCDDTIRREIDRGKLRGVKIGRVWRIRVSELEAYLRRCENKA